MAKCPQNRKKRENTSGDGQQDTTANTASVVEKGGQSLYIHAESGKVLCQELLIQLEAFIAYYSPILEDVYSTIPPGRLWEFAIIQLKSTLGFMPISIWRWRIRTSDKQKTYHMIYVICHAETPTD